MMIRVPIARDSVHLWQLHSDDPDLDVLLPRLVDALSPDERERYDRIIVAHGRREQVLTRHLVRRVLSCYERRDPMRWRFGEGSYGRPIIERESANAGDEHIEGLDFNLSHSRGQIVCLVAVDRVVGVDVEETGRARKSIQIADRFFSPREAAALRALPSAEQPQRFIDYWTLKEAYIKARGMGLHLPLGQFSFHLDEPLIRISFGPEIDDLPERWYFELRPGRDTRADGVPPRHQLALALARDPDGAAPRVITHDAKPLFVGAPP